MKTEEFSERTLELAGWPVRITSYKLGAEYFAAADNVSPGANIARATGKSRDEAEAAVMELAQRRLARTKKHEV